MLLKENAQITNIHNIRFYRYYNHFKKILYTMFYKLIKNFNEIYKFLEEYQDGHTEKS